MNALKLVRLRGFDNESNNVINSSFALANEYSCKEITSSHLLYSLLQDRTIRRMFKDDFDIDAQRYEKHFIDELIENEHNMSASAYDRTVGINDISSELQTLLSRVAYKALNTNRDVDIKSLYNTIVNDKHCSAWNTLEKMGIDKSMTNTKLTSPLEYMPITANFATDYNVLAKNRRFDPISSREKEINLIFEVMGRRIKNNPCLVGDPGVGKTAIIEGMAQMINSGNVPPYLKDKHIISVDISGIVSGSKFRGDFEERLNGVLNEAASNKEVILFFDEIHMLADAGTTSGESTMTALNILKPAISRGDVQIIGATTYPEYRKFIEKDKAFERRMELVDIPEPCINDAITMVKGVVPNYTSFHDCNLGDGVIESAVKLSDRYITDKRLPDKAITLIDDTAAHIKRINGGQKFTVNVPDIHETISRMTGIDISDIDSESREKLNSLSTRLMSHVIGQDNAVVSVSKAIRRSKAGIKDPNRPIGSFLLVGPTGVGKTELCKALAIEFGGGIKNLIRFDMSEFMEKHSVSKLIGSPPGYVGYTDGGQLTEAVRRNPYSIILFDEIEKAHPDIFNIMLQILDDGILTDSQGIKVDFKNTVIIMTSNAGYGVEDDNKKRVGFGNVDNSTKIDAEKVEKDALKALESTFRPEFLNRVDKTVVFNKLSEDNIKGIVELLLNQVNTRISESGIKISWDDIFVGYIAKVGFSDKYGARNIKRKIQDTLEDEIADRIINGDAVEGDVIQIAYSEQEGVQFNIDRTLEVHEIDLSKNVLDTNVTSMTGHSEL